MSDNEAPRRSFLDRFLSGIERVGNRLPDPAVLFLIMTVLIWVLSALLAPIQFTEIDPRSGEAISVNNQLTGAAFVNFLTRLVSIFTGFYPLGVVLVAMLGVGVAEHTGFINAGLKGALKVTSARWLSPMVIFVGILSHTAVDAGYVLVIPLGGLIFYAAGRHPLAGIAAAFAGVSGGFSANFIPSALDPLLQGLSQAAAQLIDTSREVNPLCNWFFTSASCLIIVAAGWLITDKIIEPRLRETHVDGDPDDLPVLEDLGTKERRALNVAMGATVLGLIGLAVACIPESSPFRGPDGSLTSAGAPLMRSIVPLIFFLFIVPGIVYGYVAGTVKNHKDIIKGMTHSMETMAYYIVLAFFVSIFIDAFAQTNIGALLALKGANFLKTLAMPGPVTIVGIILLTGAINLLVGSASAKWALLAPIFVPMLMALGISPELTQAAYRVGDSTTNIITPLMPYFPLVVVFAQRYVKGTGIGTIVSLMLPYSVIFLAIWTVLLIIFWLAGIPLGLQAPYTYP